MTMLRGTIEHRLKPDAGDEACLSAHLRESPRPVNGDVTCRGMVVCKLQGLTASNMMWTLLFENCFLPDLYLVSNYFRM